MALNEDRKTFLLIGRTQAGKSTLYNRLAQLSSTYSESASTGNGQSSCTSKSEHYDVDIPIVEYDLIDAHTGKVPELALDTDEDRIWRKRIPIKFADPLDPEGKPPKYKVLPHGKPSYVFKMRIIDTPGLDDTRVEKNQSLDFEHITNILAKLHALSHSPHVWERKVHGIILIETYNGFFGDTGKKTIQFYQKCMKNLFGQLIMINTRFGYESLFSTRQQYLKAKPAPLINDTESCIPIMSKKRQEKLAEILGQSLLPQVFYIDNAPREILPYEDMVSRNKLISIVDHLSKLQPMEIKQMMIIKEQSMLAVDSRLKSLLGSVCNKLDARKTKKLRASSNLLQQMRTSMQTEIGEWKNKVKHIEEQLELIDNDTQFTINRYPSTGEYTNWRIIVSKIGGSGVQGSVTASEPAHPGFQVDHPDSTSGKWVWTGWTKRDVEWKGEYQALPGKRPELVARTYVTNRVKYAEKIAVLQSKQRRFRFELSNAEADFEREFGRENDLRFDPDMEKIVLQIRAINYLDEELGKDEISVKDGFGPAARERYRNNFQGITMDHLLAFVEEARKTVSEDLKLAMTHLLEEL